jgi:hypothetical protein
MLFVAAMLAGLSFFLGVHPPTSLVALGEPWFIYFWYYSTFLSGATGIISLILPQKTASQVLRVLLLEAGALIALSAALFGYAASITFIGHQAVAALYLFGWIYVCSLRAFRINKSIKSLRKVYRWDGAN